MQSRARCTSPFAAALVWPGPVGGERTIGRLRCALAHHHDVRDSVGSTHCRHNYCQSHEHLNIHAVATVAAADTPAADGLNPVCLTLNSSAANASRVSLRNFLSKFLMILTN